MGKRDMTMEYYSCNGQEADEVGRKREVGVQLGVWDLR